LQAAFDHCATLLNLQLHATADEKEAYKRARRELLQQSEIKKDDLILFEDRLLGKGAKGTVFEGVYCGTTVACKTIELSGTPKEIEHAMKYAKKEFAHTAKATHPNIVTVYGICYEFKSKVHVSRVLSSRRVGHVCLTNLFCLQVLIVMEKLRCTLREHIVERAEAGDPLADAERLEMIDGVFRGLQKLHSCDPPIYHRDLKGANVMLGYGGGKVKLVDFGLAKSKLDTIGTKSRTGGAMGTVRLVVSLALPARVG
jgi:serine/threonine protein kinase